MAFPILGAVGFFTYIFGCVGEELEDLDLLLFFPIAGTPIFGFCVFGAFYFSRTTLGCFSELEDLDLSI